MKAIIKTKIHIFQKYMLDLLAHFSCKASTSKKKRMADLLTFLAYDILKIRKNYVIKALKEHLQITDSKAQNLSRKIYKNFLLNSIEMSGLKYITSENLVDRISIDGLEYLQTALSKGHGAIIVSGHFGLWELVPPWLSINGFEVTIVVRKQNNAEVNSWMEEMRQKHGPLTTDSGYSIRGILKALKKGHILALMIDQDSGKQGIFVKYLNKWASAPVGPAQISLRTGAPIVPLAMIPDYKNKHLIKVFKPIFPEDYNNNAIGQQSMSQDYTTTIERLVKNNPEQWFWLHRRWKTQPKDCPKNPWVKLM